MEPFRRRCVAGMLAALFSFASPLLAQPVPADPVFDVAAHAIAHGTVPEERLTQAGLPAHYEKMPFICGTPAVEAAQRFEREAAGLPPAERDRLLAWPAPVPSWPSPEPEYVVDLTRIEEVRVARLGGRHVVVLRHSVIPGSTRDAWHHPPPTARLTYVGPHLSGAGPVTVWRDGRPLAFCDGPWLLAEVRPDEDPILITLWDHLPAGGPIELTVEQMSPGEPGADTPSWYGFLDAEATGAQIELSPASQEAGDGLRIEVTRPQAAPTLVLVATDRSARAAGD